MWSDLRRFLFRGRPGEAVLVFMLIAGLGAVPILAMPGDQSAAAGIGLVAGWLVVAAILGWLVAARMAADAVDVGAGEQDAGGWLNEGDRKFLTRRPSFSCSEQELAALAETELAALPDWIQAAIERDNVAISIEDQRDGEPRTLGLYQSYGYGSAQMREITLYRLSIMRAAGSRDRLRQVVHETLLHELGHLFGMSERDLDDYTIGNRPRPGAQPVHPPPEDQITGR